MECTIRKLANIYEFYKSTLAVNFAICLVTSLFGNLQSLPYVFVSFGFVVSLAFKEIYHKNDYLFYSNNGIYKTQLIIYCFCLNVFFSFSAVLFLYLIKHLF